MLSLWFNTVVGCLFIGSRYKGVIHLLGNVFIVLNILYVDVKIAGCCRSVH